MQRHWRTVAPPLNVTLAAFVGFKPKTVRQTEPQTAEPDTFDIDEFLRVADAFK